MNHTCVINHVFIFPYFLYCISSQVKNHVSLHHVYLKYRGVEEEENWFWNSEGLRPVEKEMATHSTVLAWRIPGMGEPGELPSMGSHRVGHDWSDLAAAAAARPMTEQIVSLYFSLFNISIYPQSSFKIQGMSSLWLLNLHLNSYVILERALETDLHLNLISTSC